MGEQTLPDIAAALTAGGHTTEAAFVTSVINQLYNAFSASKYPYGSEYTYDNTGEEAVYMAAKQNGNTSVLTKVNAKTRACRGQEPVWYYYADPVTLNGENWWQFQYTAALAGYGHGRLRAHAVDDARARRAAVVRRQDRQHQRHQLRADRLRPPPTWGPSPGRTRR